MRRYSIEDQIEILKSLKMADLHRHFDGSVRPETLWNLSQKYYSAIPGLNYEEFRRYLCYDAEGNGSLIDYLDKFDVPLQYTQFYDNLLQIAFEIAEDAYTDGIRTLELRINPIIHTRAGLTIRQVLHSVRKGIMKFQKEHPDFAAGIVVIALRSHGGNMARILLRQIAGEHHQYHERVGVVGFDIAGAERPYPPILFSGAYRLAAQMGFFKTCHVGEDEGPEKIWEALDCLGPQRLGHAVSAVKDAPLLRRLARDKVLIEICLSSNLQTRAVHSLAEHPLPKFLEAGIPCSLCTDNTTVSSTTLVKEYLLAIETFDLSESDVRKLVAMGQDWSFVRRTGLDYS
ncbi:MAG: adenosine deaminase [Candidatus Eisenbacteria sp.]|nr:adenosine deaminase [Candidatus Eisenbacteria bacterium]